MQIKVLESKQICLGSSFVQLYFKYYTLYIEDDNFLQQVQNAQGPICLIKYLKYQKKQSDQIRYIIHKILNYDITSKLTTKMKAGQIASLKDLTYRDKCQIRTMSKPIQHAERIAELVMMFDKSKSGQPYNWKAFCQFITNEMDKLIYLQPGDLDEVQVNNIRNFIKIHQLDSEQVRKKIRNFNYGMEVFYNWTLNTFIAFIKMILEFNYHNIEIVISLTKSNIKVFIDSFYTFTVMKHEQNKNKQLDPQHNIQCTIGSPIQIILHLIISFFCLSFYIIQFIIQSPHFVTLLCKHLTTCLHYILQLSYCPQCTCQTFLFCLLHALILHLEILVAVVSHLFVL